MNVMTAVKEGTGRGWRAVGPGGRPRSVPALLDLVCAHGEVNSYTRTHAPRVLHLLDVVEDVFHDRGLEAPALTVCGPGLESFALRQWLPQARLTEVGYCDHLPHEGDEDDVVDFDLNEAYHPERWPDLEGQDVVLLCEVIEHLYTSPVAVLECLASWLAPGGRVIVQTPNALALSRRVRAVLGRPQYGAITGFTPRGMNPKHFREYAPWEMEEAGRQAGLEVERADIRNYFSTQSRRHAVVHPVLERMPPGLRQGQTLVFRRDA
jgi:SAM-dependent methyltransferase